MRSITPIVGWGLGWSVGLVASIGVIGTAALWSAPWLGGLLAPAIGTVAFGLPIRLGARRNCSPRPNLEALIWVLGFTVAVWLLTYHAGHAGASTQLASPGDLNINTTETMRVRQAYFDTFGRSPEDVAEVVFWCAVIGAFGGGCGVLSSIAATWRWQSGADAGRSLAFGALSVLALFAGLWVCTIGSYLFAGIMARSFRMMGALAGVMAAGFVGGSVVGTILESARRVWLKSPGAAA